MKIYFKNRSAFSGTLGIAKSDRIQLVKFLAHALCEEYTSLKITYHKHLFNYMYYNKMQEQTLITAANTFCVGYILIVFHVKRSLEGL